MKIDEKWAALKSLPPGILVSDQGHIRIYDDGEHFHEAELKTYNGVICFNFRYKTIQVHRVVAEAFVENPDPEHLTIVKHKNGDVTDNRAENLEWAAHASNFSNYRSCRNKIYCVEKDIVYGSLRSAAYANGIQQDMLSEFIKQGQPIFGLTFKKVDSNDHSFDDKGVAYCEFNDLLDCVKACDSVEEFNKMAKNLIDG